MLSEAVAIGSHRDCCSCLLLMALDSGCGGVGACLAWLAILNKHWHRHSPRRLLLLARAVVLLHLLLSSFVFGLALHLVAVVLKPDFDLSGGEVDHTG